MQNVGLCACNVAKDEVKIIWRPDQALPYEILAIIYHAQVKGFQLGLDSLVQHFLGKRPYHVR